MRVALDRDTRFYAGGDITLIPAGTEGTVIPSDALGLLCVNFDGYGEFIVPQQWIKGVDNG